MDDKELIQLVHDMLMNGEKKVNIIKKIEEISGHSKTHAYRIFDKYMTDPKFVGIRTDIKESIKKSLYFMYMGSAGKGYNRAAVEVLDRMLLVMPWIKDEEEVKKDMEINLIIKEWKKDEDED